MAANTKPKWCDHVLDVRSIASSLAKARRWDRRAFTDLNRRARVLVYGAELGADGPTEITWREELVGLIRQTKSLDFMLLTKRPENIGRLFPPDVLERCYVGVSVGTQRDADAMIPILLKTPALVRFVSLEPMLVAVDLSSYMWPVCERWPAGYESPEAARAAGERVTKRRQGLVLSGSRFIDWVIVGGESGPKARPMHPQWALDIRDQCAAAGVPYFFKQWGEWAPIDQPWKQNSPHPLAENEQWLNVEGGQGFHGEDVWRMRLVGKKRSGRLLDGRKHNEMPEVRR